MKLFKKLSKLEYIEAELVRLHNEAADFTFEDSVELDRKEGTALFEAYKLVYLQIDKMNSALIEELKNE